MVRSVKDLDCKSMLRTTEDIIVKNKKSSIEKILGIKKLLAVCRRRGVVAHASDSGLDAGAAVGKHQSRRPMNEIESCALVAEFPSNFSPSNRAHR